jgi:hypothetical protein
MEIELNNKPSKGSSQISTTTLKTGTQDMKNYQSEAQRIATLKDVYKNNPVCLLWLDINGMRGEEMPPAVKKLSLKLRAENHATLKSIVNNTLGTSF